MNDSQQFDERDFDFEGHLSQEMKRVPAPEGFADRVMYRVADRFADGAKQRRGRLAVMPRPTAWMAIAAMLLMAALLGGWQWRQQKIRREREQAEVIQRQFDVALQVTQRTLLDVQERIGHAGEVQKSERQ